MNNSIALGKYMEYTSGQNFCQFVIKTVSAFFLTYRNKKNQIKIQIYHGNRYH